MRSQQIIKRSARRVGQTHEYTLYLKAELEKKGKVGIVITNNPDDILRRLRRLGVSATAEKNYRTSMFSKEKSECGYIFKLIRQDDPNRKRNT